jgi:hypothetical protein
VLADKQSESDVPVFFFGEHTFEWITPDWDTIKRYSSKDVFVLPTTSLRGVFRRALREIGEPETWPSPEVFKDENMPKPVKASKRMYTQETVVDAWNVLAIYVVV